MDRNDQHDAAAKPGGAAAPPRKGAGPQQDPDQVKRGLLAKARQIVDQTPEVRPEKVAAIRAARSRGSYLIDSRKLANILLAEMLLKK